MQLLNFLNRQESEFCLVQKWAHFPENSSGEFLPFLCTLILSPPTKLPLDINCVIAAFTAGIGSNYVCSKPSRSVINVIHDRAKWRCPPSLRASTEGTWGWGGGGGWSSWRIMPCAALCDALSKKSGHSTASWDVWTCPRPTHAWSGVCTVCENDEVWWIMVSTLSMHAFVGSLFIDTTFPRCLTMCLTCEYKVYTRDIWYELSVMWFESVPSVLKMNH